MNISMLPHNDIHVYPDRSCVQMLVVGRLATILSGVRLCCQAFGCAARRSDGAGAGCQDHGPF